MATVTELTEGRFALSLGEAVELTSLVNRSLIFTPIGDGGEYEMEFKVKFKTKKRFDASNAAANKFLPTDGSLAVLKKGVADAAQLEVPQFRFYLTEGGEVHMEVDVKVPGGDKGNHGN